MAESSVEFVELICFSLDSKAFATGERFLDNPMPAYELLNRQQAYLMAIFKQEQVKPLNLRKMHDGIHKFEVLDKDS